MPNREQLPGETIPAADEHLRRLIERVAFQANRTAKGPSPEAVHDFRVAIRRMEQSLATFKPVLPRKAVKRIRKQLKAVLSRAGAVRDYDIALTVLQKIKEPGSRELLRAIRTRRKTAERSLLTGLKRLSLRTRIAQWFADLELHALRDESVAKARGVTANSLARQAERFFEAGESAASHDSGGRLHDFRIRAKKLRYALELFVPMYGPEMEERIQRIKSVQSVLGRMNDYRIVLAMAIEAGCGKALKGFLKRSERRQIRKFREIWAEQFSSSIAAEWKRALKTGQQERRIPRKPVTSSEIPPQDAAATQA